MNKQLNNYMLHYKINKFHFFINDIKKQHKTCVLMTVNNNNNTKHISIISDIHTDILRLRMFTLVFRNSEIHS
jgi:hypothetical protein